MSDKIIQKPPRKGEYVGNCGGSGNPHVETIFSENEVTVRINKVGLFFCEVARDQDGHLVAVKSLQVHKSC